MIIAHLTSVHPRFDIRIYYMMCKSLRKLGDVHIICADGKGDQNLDGINIIDVSTSAVRLFSMDLDNSWESQKEKIRTTYQNLLVSI
jgi:hypothetical protein